MPYLDPQTGTLSSEQAAHLLRRATVGPTKAEIIQFTGKTPLEAYNILIANIVLDPAPPVVTNAESPSFNTTFVHLPFLGSENFDRGSDIKAWWMHQLTRTDTGPNLLEKLSIFWQNHFVTTREIASDYRYVWRYLDTIRKNSLGNFKDFIVKMTKDPSMLVYLNGNENVKTAPNENYARELQELFVVGEKDFNGNLNYTEADVKNAAKVLTGWHYKNFWWDGTTDINSTFADWDHDTTNKTFSAKYNNTTITGRSGATSGQLELEDLTNMLLAHPESAKFIVRKLYKWFVNMEVSQDIETNIIIPLANEFKSTANNWAIEPIVKKLLLSQNFYDEDNIGSIIKNPVDLCLGSLKYWEFPIPNMTTQTLAWREYFHHHLWILYTMQMSLIDQPSVFGWEPFYQQSLSRGWINSNSIAVRNDYTDQFIWGWKEISPGYNLGINVIDRLKAIQPNFALNLPLNQAISPATAVDTITAEQVLAHFTDNLLVKPLFQTQKDFLIDTIMMFGNPRNAWKVEWTTYRRNSYHYNQTGVKPAGYDDNFNGIRWRVQSLLRYILRMAEYHVS